MKNKKKTVTKNVSEDTQEVKTLIIITIIIVLISVGLYFLTDALDKKKAIEEIPEATINYSEITIGTMFTRPYNEYYVFAYKEDDDNAGKFDDLFTKYEEKEKSKKIYYIDLADKFNQSVLSDKSNKKPEQVTDVKIKDYALILIKDGKVSKYYETISEIEKALS